MVIHWGGFFYAKSNKRDLHKREQFITLNKENNVRVF